MITNTDHRDHKFYRKKPIIIEAVQWDGLTHTVSWMNKNGFNAHNYSHNYTQIPLIVKDLTLFSLEGDVKVEIGQWIIKGIKNELYTCQNDIFKITYEPIPNERKQNGTIQ